MLKAAMTRSFEASQASQHRYRRPHCHCVELDNVVNRLAGFQRDIDHDFKLCSIYCNHLQSTFLTLWLVKYKQYMLLPHDPPKSADRPIDWSKLEKDNH